MVAEEFSWATCEAEVYTIHYTLPRTKSVKNSIGKYKNSQPLVTVPMGDPSIHSLSGPNRDKNLLSMVAAVWLSGYGPPILQPYLPPPQ